VLTKGNENSVTTPLSVINFHTHPISCYTEENVKWGWPSGEDARQCIVFAQKGNLVHLVFSQEGTYVIKVLNFKSLTPTVINYIEDFFKMTHQYRSKGNLKALNSAFYEKMCKPIGINGPERTSCLQWLQLINGITTNKLKKMNSKLKIKGDDNPIFEVTLIPRNKNVTFSGNYVSGNCKL